VEGSSGRWFGLMGTIYEIRLRIIIDSNVFIDIEDHGYSTSSSTSIAARFSQVAARTGCVLVVAHGTRSDLIRAPAEMRNRRMAALEKFHILEKPHIPHDLHIESGFPVAPSVNDQIDLEILAALSNGAADWLVTNDRTLLSRARRGGFPDRVFSVGEAIESLELVLAIPTSVPNVTTAKGYQFDLDADLFITLRHDYPEFSDWWRDKVTYSHRDILVIGEAANPEGISVVKVEQDNAYGLGERVLKICTFKVSERLGGSRRGELLINASIDYARKNRCSSVYLEVLLEKDEFLDWLHRFGFRRKDKWCTSRNEGVFWKRLHTEPTDPIRSDPLAYNIAFGPGALVISEPLVIPIRRAWRRRLFPQPEPQKSLFPFEEACGNAIRKAYLCNAGTRVVRPGQTALFYESEGRSAIVAAGVVESAFVSHRPNEILRYVGNRSVYSHAEIAHLCTKGEVLGILFRYDRSILPPWPLHDLVRANVLLGAPQSIQRVKEDGLRWIRQKFAE